ncbi:MAG: hypothetical protein GF311_28255 [Candidatus Lokiarchaeota archaeon]|nr:hypothetical protein [Candidatus Lokiarchaeota archaeon]
METKKKIIEIYSSDLLNEFRKIMKNFGNFDASFLWQSCYRTGKLPYDWSEVKNLKLTRTKLVAYLFNGALILIKKGEPNGN